MDFISNQTVQIRQMLSTIGIADVADLFESIPDHLRISAPCKDDGMSECEGMRLMEALAAKNTYSRYDNYLGGGSYEHHVPAIVNAICSKSEFLTAYTPYQAEASQGMLQGIFEFQSAICALTGMDVSNASLYDGASACAEALLMALRCRPGRNKVVVTQNLHPHYRGVIEQYLFSHKTHIVTVPCLSNGQTDIQNLKEVLDQDTAAVLMQYPNFFGVIDDIAGLCLEAKSVDALAVICANPLVYGLFSSAADLGADIAIGDCQPLGLPLQYGGPYAGYIACKEPLMRQLPGRIVGETLDQRGQRGFVLTLQAREQHIRREKATSNICTNQSLAALASLVCILWYGKQGLHDLALTNYQRAAYLKHSLEAMPHIKKIAEAPFLNEFMVGFEKPIGEVLTHFRACHIEPGIALETFFPEFKNVLLIAVTEIKSKEQLDRFLEVAGELQ